MQPEKTPKNGPGEKSLSGEAPLQKPPSMLWFVIPLGLIMLYALLTR
jgi:hypothetical protein